MTDTLEGGALDPLDAPGEEKDRQFVTALYRGLEILSAFRPGDTELGNQELAERTGIPKPTITRLTYTLTKLGYLRHSGSRRLYRLDSRVLSLGYSYFMAIELREHARALIQTMAEDVNAVVSLGVPAGLEMIYIETARGDGPITLGLQLGARIPIAPTSMGRAYLALLPDSERETLLSRIRMEEPETCDQTLAGMSQSLEEFRTRGFTMSVGSWHPEVNSVGTALRDSSSGTIYGLNCGGPAFMLTPERLRDELGPRLVSLTRQLAPGGAR